MRLLRTGSRGPAVQLLQLALNRAGYGTLEQDGIFGAATAEAVRRFQKDHGLLTDAVVGERTHHALLPWYTGYFTHRIERGDTLYRLAMRFGTSVRALRIANPRLREDNLPVGGTLTVPLPFAVVPTELDWFAGLTALCVRGLTARYPFLRGGSIGKSVMGRPLHSLTLGTGDNRVLYNAAHHANEWITTPLLLRFAEELAAAYADRGSVFGMSAEGILAHTTLCLIPSVDPDGTDLVTGELSGGVYFENAKRIAARYPRYPFPGGWKANIRGVDLNLQYPAGWEQARENKYAIGIVSPAPADYVGTAPLTEPEARAMFDYTRKFSPALILALHTQGEVIYWRYLYNEPPRSREIAESFAAVSGYSVEDTPFVSGFAGYKDWFIQNFDRPGYTIESGVGTNPLPLTQFDTLYRRTLGILALGAVMT